MQRDHRRPGKICVRISPTVNESTNVLRESRRYRVSVEILRQHGFSTNGLCGRFLHSPNRCLRHCFNRLLFVRPPQRTTATRGLKTRKKPALTAKTSGSCPYVQRVTRGLHPRASLKPIVASADPPRPHQRVRSESIINCENGRVHLHQDIPCQIPRKCNPKNRRETKRQQPETDAPCANAVTEPRRITSPPRTASSARTTQSPAATARSPMAASETCCVPPTSASQTASNTWRCYALFTGSVTYWRNSSMRSARDW